MTHAALPTFRFPGGTCIPQAQPPMHGPVSMESPALQVMTDLAEVRAATTTPEMPLAQAEAKMIHQGVRLLFVSTEMPCVDGIVTALDLQGNKPLRLVHQRHARYEDLCVGDVMTPLTELDAIDFASLRKATVGHVVATLLKFGRPHLLVVEGFTASAPARIRGLISQSQVERQLGHALPTAEVASTFAEIEQALA